MNLKVRILLVSLILCFFIVINSNVSANEVLSEESIKTLLEKYDLEIISERKLNSNDIININTLSDLENIILKIKNVPDKIQMEEIHVHKSITDTILFGVNSNQFNYRNSGVATLNERSEIHNGLIINYSATGRYSTKNNKKYWAKVNSTSVKEHSSTDWAKLDEVKKSTGIISKDCARIEHSYEFTVQNYLVVPIPGISKVLKIKAAHQTVTGTIYYYARRI